MNGLTALWLAFEAQLPHTPTDLYLLDIVSMAAFVAVASVTGIYHHRRFDLYRVLRNGVGSGAAFPPSVLLIFYPVTQPVRALFGTEPLKAYLMIAGATGVVLSLYGLFRA